MNTCKICFSNKNNKTYVAREMMLGLREEFVYFECSNCGCLQIKDIPKDISKYYPKDYSPFQNLIPSKDSFIKSFLKYHIAKHIILKKNFFGLLLENNKKFRLIKKIGNVNIDFNSKILDVGSASGNILLDLQKYGFKNLIGSDIYIDSDIFYENGVRIYKKDISEIDQQFDFIMLNHSFEHMFDPLSVLTELKRLIKPGKYILIRIPVAGSYAWTKYGINWIALDAPRHIFLHTPKSINILVEKVGLKLERIVYDSTGKQFWGSEQYSKNISLKDDNSYDKNPSNSIFSKSQIKEFNRKAIELNKQQKGDAACFYLSKPDLQ
jgi:SAM-dependent methyltransferase